MDRQVIRQKLESLRRSLQTKWPANVQILQAKLHQSVAVAVAWQKPQVMPLNKIWLVLPPAASGT